MTDVEITIGPYLIRPQGNRPDGRVLIEVTRVEGQDAHDHATGPVRVIDVDELFDGEKS